ncbi:hypothetical protein [Streptomyces violaceus]|uniref:Uncharacterized protein n=1 Tax=Streptomyces violaceus TaxID=1936 RepID=A0ABZ1P383_STRVL
MNRTRWRRGRRAVTLLAAASTLASVTTGVATADDSMSQALVPWRDQAGPAVFHQPPPRAPQLESTGIWKAEPTQVCMTSAYRRGEFLYQGCLWDDRGAGAPLDWPAGTMVKAYTYPKDPVYRSNAADLVELRARPLPDATAFRLTFNTMTDPDLVATTIALGDSPTPVAAPFGANTVMPAQTFVTVHGRTAEVVDAKTGDKAGSLTATVDTERRQIEVRVPHSAFDPTGRTAVRLAAATGLWDKEANRYLIPQALADEKHPGGALPTTLRPSAFFDVAFRYDEPIDGAWRDEQQKTTLLTGDISKFHTIVDFTKLATATDDDMTGQRGGVPKTGYIQRIYASHFELAQGRRQPTDPGAPPTGANTQQGGLTTSTDGSTDVSGQFGWVCREDCVPDLAGRLQRYIVYVPKLTAPEKGYGSLTFTPGYAMTPADVVGESRDLYTSVANRSSAPTLVMAVDGRGNDNWFYGQSGAGVFEALADLGRHYRLDPNRRMMSGFSSGAYGANKLSLTFPDFFSKAFVCDGLNKAPSFPGVNGVADTLPVDTVTQHEPGSVLTPLLPSRRNQPVMEWAGAPDDFIPYHIPRERADAYAAGDYDYEFVTWLGASSEHLIMCHNGTWDLFTKWAGTGERTKTPAHVTYVRNPLMDDELFGLVGDRAYWLSDIRTRGTDGSTGTIDVVSRGLGLADPAVPPVAKGAGIASGTTIPLNPYTREYRKLSAPDTVAAVNELKITATNIRTVTIDPRQAEVGCDAKLDVRTDGPLQVVLLGCGAPRTFGEG